MVRPTTPKGTTIHLYCYYWIRVGSKNENRKNAVLYLTTPTLHFFEKKNDVHCLNPRNNIVWISGEWRLNVKVIFLWTGTGNVKPEISQGRDTRDYCVRRKCVLRLYLWWLHMVTKIRARMKGDDVLMLGADVRSFVPSSSRILYSGHQRLQ